MRAAGPHIIHARSPGPPVNDHISHPMQISKTFAQAERAFAIFAYRRRGQRESSFAAAIRTWRIIRTRDCLALAAAMRPLHCDRKTGRRARAFRGLERHCGAVTGHFSSVFRARSSSVIANPRTAARAARARATHGGGGGGGGGGTPFGLPFRIERPLPPHGPRGAEHGRAGGARMCAVPAKSETRDRAMPAPTHRQVRCTRSARASNNAPAA